MQPGWAEQRPEDWWRALGEAVSGAVSASGKVKGEAIEEQGA